MALSCYAVVAVVAAVTQVQALEVRTEPVVQMAHQASSRRISNWTLRMYQTESQ